MSAITTPKPSIPYKSISTKTHKDGSTSTFINVGRAQTNVRYEKRHHVVGSTTYSKQVKLVTTKSGWIETTLDSSQFSKRFQEARAQIARHSLASTLP